MYREEDYPIEDIIDVETLYSGEIELDEEDMEALRERAAETGEDLDDLAERFIAYLKVSLDNVPEEVKEMQRISSMYARGLLKDED